MTLTVSLPEGTILQSASVSSTSAALKIPRLIAEETTLASASGNVRAMLPEQPGFPRTVSAVSGSFASPIALQKSGDAYICGDGSGACDIGTVSGNIPLGKNE